MRLFAISDLHLGNKANRNALVSLSAHPEDWLILAGDVGETTEHLIFALSILTQKFKQIVWTPGNHDLWTLPFTSTAKKGEYKYSELLSVCSDYKVLTPEDTFAEITIQNLKYIIAPILTLYDYSFRPENIRLENAVSWAKESGVMCADEELLFSDPYDSIVDWCQKRCKLTEARLKELPSDIPIILVNHFPVLEEHTKLQHFPRFTLWCGTKNTEDWINKFNIKIVVFGHMHKRETIYKKGVKFEEVSFGYPCDWNVNRGIEYYLRRIDLVEDCSDPLSNREKRAKSLNI
jgi:3',5'-cyclic AMP phosphodiesterase CpdA